MHLVAFACPPHYHIVQLAVRQARKCYPDIDQCTIVWDDVYLARKLSAFDLAQSLSIETGATVVKHSDFVCCQGEVNGWLRQQYIKLHLHEYFTDQAWLLLDGDTVLRNSHSYRNEQQQVIFDSYFYDRYEPAVSFIQQALKISNIEPGQGWMTPHWVAERTVLEALHQWFVDQWGQSFLDYFSSYKLVTDPKKTPYWAPLNEIELYANFALHQMNHPITRIPSNLKGCLPQEFVNLWTTTNLDLCLGGRDNFDMSFWTSQGIKRHLELDRALNA